MNLYHPTYYTLVSTPFPWQRDRGMFLCPRCFDLEYKEYKDISLASIQNGEFSFLQSPHSIRIAPLDGTVWGATSTKYLGESARCSKCGKPINNIFKVNGKE